MLRRRSLYGASGSQEVIDLSYRDIYGNDTVTRNTANCYVVRENGSYKIPLIYGNGIKNGKVNTSAYTSPNYTNCSAFYNHIGYSIKQPYIEKMSGCVAITPCLAWCEAQDVISNLEIVDGDDGVRMLTFNVSNFPALGANAIIGILDSNGDFIWSWHIWLYADELFTVKVTNTESYIYDLLNVNLGWSWDSSSKTDGKNVFYQWGRKDAMPSPASGSSTSEHILFGEKGFIINSSNLSWETSIKMPYAFMQGSSSGTWASQTPYNFWDNGINSTYASAIKPIKTIFDPCPVGFRIPAGTTFDYFNKSSIDEFSKGWKFKRNASDTEGCFFSAAGFRAGTTGLIKEVGNQGYYHTASRSDSKKCYTLCFTSSLVRVTNYDYVSHGFTVRPITDN